jgi:hypothetical protein
MCLMIIELNDTIIINEQTTNTFYNIDYINIDYNIIYFKMKRDLCKIYVIFIEFVHKRCWL